MQDLIHDAIKNLMEESYLYRSRRVDIAPILAEADATWPKEKLTREFTHRRWIPWSQNRGFTQGEQRLLNSPKGCDPIGTPPEEMSLGFVIPTVNTWCYKCELVTLQDSIPHLEHSPYHFNREAIAEPLGIQNFLFHFMCHVCKAPPTLFMIRRERLKVQLCGRSHPFLPKPPPEIPKACGPIFRDAMGAAACGDLHGAFYHLRTLMEQHMKDQLAIPLTEKIDGDSLCAQYNQITDPTVRDRCSLKVTFDLCSANLHNRKGTVAEYEGAIETLKTHFKLVEILKELTSKPAQ